MTHGPIRQEYAYDLDKNLTGLTVRSGDTLLAQTSYAYDGNGNRTRKQALDGTTLYQYDALNQLQRVDYPAYSEELFYDKAGNPLPASAGRRRGVVPVRPSQSSDGPHPGRCDHPVPV